MLSILGRPGRLCDMPARREVLTVGGVSLVGLSLPEVLRRQAASQESRGGPSFGRARSMILLYLQGSPSHIDVWDPKPNAPAEAGTRFVQVTWPAGSDTEPAYALGID